MARLFGTNGIRGVFGEDFDLEFVHDITLSIAAHLRGKKVLVGYDGRDSSIVVAKTVCSTLNFAGIDCSLGGLVPTPCLEYATRALGYDWGMMITASHNPPQYNGIKPVASDGVEISREDELKIEDIYFAKTWPDVPGSWGITIPDDRIVSTYCEAIISHVNQSAIRAKNFTVVLDTGNGVQAVTAPVICKMLGCNAVVINKEIDGRFPGRGSEPTPENLDKLSKTVRDSGAALGVAFDGDGDRSVFCDETGQILTGDKSALLLTKFLLEKSPGSAVVTCLNSGSSIELLAKESGSKVIRTKVGSVEVSRRMVQDDALIGFEENGGFMYGRHNKVRDGAMSLAIALDMLALTDRAMSDLLQDLPPSFTTKDKISCSTNDAKRLLSVLISQNPDADTTDGVKITIDEKSWVMIRPSGTEPIVRIYAESDSSTRLAKIMSEYLEELRSILARH